MKLIASAMAGGLTVMAGAILWFYLESEAKEPQAAQLFMVNVMTIAAMIFAVIAIVISEIMWRLILRRPAVEPAARVRTAFIVRLACREGAALLGMAVAYCAARDGVLRAYPAYWVNMAPYALFLSFLGLHWPSEEKLAAEAKGVLS